MIVGRQPSGVKITRLSRIAAVAKRTGCLYIFEKTVIHHASYWLEPLAIGTEKKRASRFWLKTEFTICTTLFHEATWQLLQYSRLKSIFGNVIDNVMGEHSLNCVITVTKSSPPNTNPWISNFPNLKRSSSPLLIQRVFLHYIFIDIQSLIRENSICQLQHKYSNTAWSYSWQKDSIFLKSLYYTVSRFPQTRLERSPFFLAEKWW